MIENLERKQKRSPQEILTSVPGLEESLAIIVARMIYGGEGTPAPTFSEQQIIDMMAESQEIQNAVEWVVTGGVNAEVGMAYWHELTLKLIKNLRERIKSDV